MDKSQQPNTEVKLVFREQDGEGGITFLNIFIEKDGREITPDLMVNGDPTVAEQWGHEMLGFVEDFLRMQLGEKKLNGNLLVMPKKKDMN